MDPLGIDPSVSSMLRKRILPFSRRSNSGTHGAGDHGPLNSTRLDLNQHPKMVTWCPHISLARNMSASLTHHAR